MQIRLQALLVAPAQTFGPLGAIGEQRPGGARDGPACRLHLRVRQHARAAKPTFVTRIGAPALLIGARGGCGPLAWTRNRISAAAAAAPERCGASRRPIP